MDDPTSPEPDPRPLVPVLVAAALATLFVAGSASLVRNRRRAGQPLPVVQDAKSQPEPPEPKSATARSKERRRRGKDPMKELLKGGKKQQHLLKPLTATTAAADPSSGALVLPVETNTAQVAGDPTPQPSDGNERPVSPTAEVPAILVSDPPVVHARQSTAPNPWEWDGQGPSKPTPAQSPRFRSKSSSRAVPEAQPTSQTGATTDDLALPTLSKPSQSAFTPSTSGSAPASASGSGSNSAPGTPPPQTQLASLRGALEAARLREEKTRSELDRATRDAEILRWENGAWRRREVELQSQVHHLMHQLQGYAALYMHNQHHLQVPGSGATSPNSPASPNGFAPPPPFAPPSPNGYGPPPPMFPPPGMPMFSPTGQLPPPFYPYPPPHPGQQQPQHPQPQHPPHPQQANLFSMLFPNASMSKSHGSGSRSRGSGSGSASSVSASASVSASSSSGADSPDLAPLANGLPLDRGRKRTRIHTADARLGGHANGRAWEEAGWIGVERDENGFAPEYDADGGGEEEDDEEEGEFSEALADAILKRPESMRVGSKRRRHKEKDAEKDKDNDADGSPPPMEFTFPSLLDLGPVRPLSVEEVAVQVAVPVEEMLESGSKHAAEEVEAGIPPPPEMESEMETDSGEVTPSPHPTSAAVPLEAAVAAVAAEPTEPR
ncbi:hypothetical protein MKEN_01050100 [Mycena kentingensis (nom. inval.)]|nr:hypothetical protein MKEN_01050100 [Mycena kentingensis (nom. inval.)]